MFLLKKESRHQMNKLRKKKGFKKSFYEIFKIKLPHLDSCQDVLKKIPPQLLKSILSKIFSFFIRNKFFYSSRLHGNVVISLDATGIGSVEPFEVDIVENEIKDEYTEVSFFDDEQDPKRTKNSNRKTHSSKWSTGKTTKKGYRCFTRSLIVLRVIGPNGISFVVDWEPINTDDGADKEDCEHNSAKRLLSRFRQNYKRLPIVLVADGLYTNQTFMNMARSDGYHFIFTLKDESLKKIWNQINDAFEPRGKQEKNLITDEKGSYDDKILVPNEKGSTDCITRGFKWINNLNHAGIQVNWAACRESVSTDADNGFNFSVLTSLNIDKNSISEIIAFSRSRNRIEDGFNSHKNRGYKIKHKYSERSDNALMNYITLLYVAEIINNLVFRCDWTQRTYFSWGSDETEKSLIEGIYESILGFDKNKDFNLQKGKIPKNTYYTMLFE